MKSSPRLHPHLIELNTRHWLWYLSTKYKTPLTLGSVPEQEWDELKKLGFDIVWLMGIWEISPTGRRTKAFIPELQREYTRAYPDWQTDDVIGSPYAIANYSLNTSLGAVSDLEKVHCQLHERNMKLITDFVPNHLACDHPLVQSNPDHFIVADDRAIRENPELFFSIQTPRGTYHIAHGKDPYFPPWTDTAQLNYFNPATVQAMQDIIMDISHYCDGVRCDMAMLCLNNIHAQTWGGLLSRLGYQKPETEFWATTIQMIRSKKPDFLFIAEVYWDLDWKLQQLGFDYTYDKILYDRLRDSSPEEIRAHLLAASDYQKHSLRFIENHDEKRALKAFGPEKVKAATVLMSTLMGLRLYHEGQIDGKTTRLPVQLLKTKENAPQPELAEYFRTLLQTINKPIFHEGEWSLLETGPAWDDNNSFRSILAWQWIQAHDLMLVAINWSRQRSFGRLFLPDRTYRDRTVVVYDHLSNNYYRSNGTEIDEMGLFIDLDAFQSHILEVKIE